MPKSKPKSKSSEDPVEGETANLPVRKRAAAAKKGDEAPAKKPRGRPKGSRNKTTTTLIPDSGAMELGIAAAHALSMPANAAGFAATLGMPSLPASVAQADDDLRPIDRGDMPKARETRLEQTRKAARESRRRKKVMIEELQRSVIFFSRANATLKTQNEEFQRLLIQAQTQIAQMEANGEVPKADGTADAAGAASAADVAVADGSAGAGTAPVDTQAAQQAVAAAQAAQQSFQFMQAQAAAQANAAAMQASFESQGYPPAAARAAAQTFSASGGDGSIDASGQGGMMAMDPQALMQMQQAWMAQNPAFMQQFAMMAQQAGGGAAASAPAPAADNGSATV